MTSKADGGASAIRLFDEIERTNPHKCGHDEAGFDFLNRVSGPYWTPVRALCEEWYGSLPAEMKADVRARFRSRDEGQSRSAFWEMYLYVAFSRLGHTITPHPEVPRTDNRPDFWVKKGAQGFFLEATYSTSSDDEISAARRENAVYAALDRLKNHDFWLKIEVERQGQESLAAAKLRKRLERELSTHDAKELHDALETKSITFRDLPLVTWKDGGWLIEVRALPKPEGVRGDPTIRPVGVIGPQAMFRDDRSSLLRTLEGKARRYGQLGAPYLLAVRLDSLTADGNDIFEALFGQCGVQIANTPDGANVVGQVREPNGLWEDRRGPRATRLSGVMFAYDTQPALVCRPSTEPFIWTNPWAEHPLPEMPWKTTGVDLERSQITSRATELVLHEAFGLPDGWPGPDEDRFPR